MKIKLKVTQADIREDGHDPTYCPVHHALRRALPKGSSDIFVTADACTFFMQEDYYRIKNKHISRWVGKYDALRTVHPFTRQVVARKTGF